MTEATRDWLASIPGTAVWRQCHRADGQPKQQLTREQAEIVAAKLTAKGEPAEAYECGVCGSHHVGAAH